MPKKVVIEYCCDRCPKKWYDDEDTSTPALSLVFKVATPGAEDVVLQYEVLCKNCQTAVANYVKGIAKKRKEEVEEPEVEVEVEDSKTEPPLPSIRT